MLQTTPSKVLKRAETAALLVTNLTNIRYLTGLNVSAGAVLLTSRKITVFLDGRYQEMASKSVPTSIVVKPAEDLTKQLQKLTQVGFEAEHVTVADLRRRKRKVKGVKFTPTTGVIEHFRRSKSPTELKKFKRAQRITRALMKKIPAHLKPGVSEQQLAWQLEQWARETGAEGLSFEPIVAFGTNSSLPHHHPGTRKLKRGMLVQIDVGAKVDGYCADQSAVFFTAKPTKKQQYVFEVVEKAKQAATKLVRPGVTNHELDQAAREVLAEFDLEQYFVHSLGHGVGLDIHEGVSLSCNSDSVELLKNEIVTIEPGVYIPGQFGIRLEDEVIV